MQVDPVIADPEKRGLFAVGTSRSDRARQGRFAKATLSCRRRAGTPPPGSRQQPPSLPAPLARPRHVFADLPTDPPPSGLAAAAL
jgi:hypothetical protein